MGVFDLFKSENEENEEIEDEEVDENIKKLLVQINDPYQGLTKVKYYENFYYEETIKKDEKITTENPKYPHILDVTSGIRKVSSKLANFSVLEYDINLALDTSDPNIEYLRSMSGKHIRQLLINLDEDHDAIIKRGTMALTAGDVEHEINAEGISDFLVQKAKSTVFNEELVYSRWYGNGQLMLEHTENAHILLLDIEDWGEKGIVVEKEMFLAADGDVDVDFTYVGKLTTWAFGGEGGFNVSLKGRGVVALINNAPMSQLMTIDLKDEELRIDGSFAVCWSSDLEFKVELSRRGNVLTSLLDREGESYMVNVYRGTGKVLVSPVANSFSSKRKKGSLKRLEDEYDYYE